MLASIRNLATCCAGANASSAQPAPALEGSRVPSGPITDASDAPRVVAHEGASEGGPDRAAVQSCAYVSSEADDCCGHVSGEHSAGSTSGVALPQVNALHLPALIVHSSPSHCR